MRIVRDFASYARFSLLTPRADKRIVFYAEHESYYPIFEGVLEELTRVHGHCVCYVTSDPKDPILTSNKQKVRTFYIKSFLQLFMRFLGSPVVIMTLPDLDNLYIKRSINSVHYVYMFHSMLSTHMGYREGAFDHYDSLLCVGPHQVAEIRRAEERYGLRPKTLVEAGYYRLERIQKSFGLRPAKTDANERPIVLIAPTWSKENLIEVYGANIVRAVLAFGYKVILRLHPEMSKRDPGVVAELRNRFGEDDRVIMETSVASDSSLLEADLLITDWSGIGVEYAFGTERPVLFVDLPRKVNNQNYENLELEPFEVFIREQIGVVLPPDQIPRIGTEIERLLAAREAYEVRLRELRKEHIYDSGRTNQIGAEHILAILDGDEPASQADLHQ